jgi:hypothetical protein
MSREPQTRKILNYLQSGNTITALKALSLFSCMRLAARIYDIGRLGYVVRREKVSRGDKWYMEYSINQEL